MADRAMNENRRRPIQFSLRSLLGLTLVVSLAFSFGRTVGLAAVVAILVIAVPIVTLVVAGMCIDENKAVNRDRIEKPLLSLAALMSYLIFSFAIAVTIFVLAFVALLVWE